MLQRENPGSIVLLLVAGLMTAGVMAAQTAGSGTMVGTVSDTTGAVVAGAKVAVVNVETAFRSESVNWWSILASKRFRRISFSWFATRFSVGPVAPGMPG